MENIWNLKELPLPPISTYKVNSFDTDVKKFHAISDNFQILRTTHPHLHSEFFILSRITYRMKQKFRTSKDFKALEKLTKSLGRYFDMSLPSDLQSVMDLIPKNYLDELYLPTKNLMDYMLVRLQGVAKLFEYIMKTSVDVAYMLSIRIQTGHFWRIGFILYSIVSRIYVLSKHIVKTICNFYLELLSISTSLMYVGKKWLPENYIFPDNLESWLDIDILKMDQDLQKIQEPPVIDILDYFKLVEDSDSEIEFTEVLNKHEEENGRFEATKHKGKNPNDERFGGFNSGEDIGQVIEILSDDNNDITDMLSKNETENKQNEKNNKNTYFNKKIIKHKDILEIGRPTNDIQELHVSLNKIRGFGNDKNSQIFGGNVRGDSKQIIDISDDNINNMSSQTLKSLAKNKRKNLRLRKKMEKNKGSFGKPNSYNKGKQKVSKMHRIHTSGCDIGEVNEKLTDNNEKIAFISENKINGMNKNNEKKNVAMKKSNSQEQKCVINIRGSKLEKHQKGSRKKIKNAKKN